MIYVLYAIFFLGNHIISPLSSSSHLSTSSHNQSPAPSETSGLNNDQIVSGSGLQTPPLSEIEITDVLRGNHFRTPSFKLEAPAQDYSLPLNHSESNCEDHLSETAINRPESPFRWLDLTIPCSTQFEHFRNTSSCTTSNNCSSIHSLKTNSLNYYSSSASPLNVDPGHKISEGKKETSNITTFMNLYHVSDTPEPDLNSGNMSSTFITNSHHFNLSQKVNNTEKSTVLNHHEQLQNQMLNNFSFTGSTKSNVGLFNTNHSNNNINLISSETSRNEPSRLYYSETGSSSPVSSNGYLISLLASQPSSEIPSTHEVKENKETVLNEKLTNLLHQSNFVQTKDGRLLEALQPAQPKPSEHFCSKITLPSFLPVASSMPHHQSLTTPNGSSTATCNSLAPTIHCQGEKEFFMFCT